MLRFGTISEVKTGFARVVFDDELQSDWLPLLFSKAATDSYFFNGDAGEYVACMMDENSENGVILGAVYSTKTQPKNVGPGITSVEFSDGTKVIHNAVTHELSIVAQKVRITGQLLVSGDVRAGVGPVPGTPSVSLLQHTHGGAGTPPIPAP
jgi:phage baseplate assembly protein V